MPDGSYWDGIGLLMRDVRVSDVAAGQVVVQPGSMTAYMTFEAVTYVPTEEEGGRKAPLLNRQRSQFYFRTADVTGEIVLPADAEMALPGDKTTMAVKLVQPVAMEVGLRFAIREGGRTIGAGVVTKVVK